MTNKEELQVDIESLTKVSYFTMADDVIRGKGMKLPLQTYVINTAVEDVAYIEKSIADSVFTIYQIKENSEENFLSSGIRYKVSITREVK